MGTVFPNYGRLSRCRLSSLALAATLMFFLVGFLPRPLNPSLLAAQIHDGGVPNIGRIIQYDSRGTALQAFRMNPIRTGKHPAVLVIHDSHGLDDATRDVVAEFAAAGFVALAPDFASRLGGKRTVDQMAEAVGQLSPNVSVADAWAAFAYLQKDPAVDAAKISAVGYGWGGWHSFMLAVSVPDLYRAVVYCGATPSESLDAVHAPVLAHYAQFDFRTTGNALLTEKTMTETGKKFTYFVYPRVNRGFYSAGPQYDAEAAKLAWSRTLDFLK